MSEDKNKTFLVTPTCRPGSALDFLWSWLNTRDLKFIADKDRIKVQGVDRLVLVWDTDESLPQEAEALTAESRLTFLTRDRWARWVPLRYQGCRTAGFAYLLPELTTPEDIVISLDDDVRPDGSLHPCSSSALALKALCDSHLEALSPRPAYRNIVEGGPPVRGLPLSQTAGGSADFNLGLWTKDPDLSAFHNWTHSSDDARKVVSEGWGNSIRGYGSKVSSAHRVAPLSSMNYAFRARCLPMLAQCPPGEAGETRFEDIWTGCLFLRCLRALHGHYAIGTPFVQHWRKSDLKNSLFAEARGLQVNERFWLAAYHAPITGSHPFEVARSAAKWLRNVNILPVPTKRWGDMIDAWVDLCSTYPVLREQWPHNP